MDAIKFMGPDGQWHVIPSVGPPGRDGTDGVENLRALTSAELSGLDAAARAALYAEGARVLKVVNGETVTLHGLGADGGLDWLGSNRPVRNLLDNGDFSVAQAGYGGMHGNTPYAADRWMGIALAGVARQGGALAVTPSAYNGRIVQILLVEPGKTYTFAVCGQGAGGPHGRMVVLSGDTSTVYAERLNVKLEGVACLTADVPAAMNVIQAWYLPAWHGSTESAALRWAALYEGAYTEDTLPPFTPKGYAAELQECRRYYISGAGAQWSVATATESGFLTIRIPIGANLRTVPSLAQNPAGELRIFEQGAWKELDLTPLGNYITPGEVMLISQISAWPNLSLQANSTYLIQYLPQLCADL